MTDRLKMRRQNAVNRANDHAPFLALLMQQRSDLVQHFIDHGATSSLMASTATVDHNADTMRQLRVLRGKTALIVALGDLAGEYDIVTTTAALTDFADYSCDMALNAAFAERLPGEPVRGVAVIALGKMGSRELNYSSDIDPILVFDPATMPRRKRDDPSEAAVRIARRWVEILSARTGDGHVHRVDLRLRPSPEATPIILSVDAAISYYESQALAWEQAAFIRSRAAAGDRRLGQQFLDAIQPFIWRRSMDFGQIARIRDITTRIRGHYPKGQLFGPGYDLKRGRGGIREIEFFAQVHQLIHGGRNVSLRAPATWNALSALAGAGHIDENTARELTAHYKLLRTIEHRLQMIDDQQTHSLPVSPTALTNAARLHGLPDGVALLRVLTPAVSAIGAAFDTLIGTHEGTDKWPHEEGESAARGLANRFSDGTALARRVAQWRSGQLRVLRSPAAQDALEQVLPSLIEALGRAGAPDAALAQFDALISRLSSAINFFTLLAARPQLLGALVDILSFAPALSADLALRGELIEGLIDASIFEALPSPDELVSRMLSRPSMNIEHRLDHVRRVVGDHRFALGVQLIQRVADADTVARGFADIADAAVHSLGNATIAEFERVHGRVPGGELIILALGRYGGRTLTHASDLDVILLHSATLKAESNGQRPLGSSTYFNRLGQRVIAALSVPTAAGRLYDVDTRLRPQGMQGPLVSSLDAFARYQRDDAWTWEHMALTRARVIYGSATMRLAVSDIISDVLSMPRDAASTRADIIAMRDDVAAHKPPNGTLDVKLLSGGLVDAEFAIHSMQLVHGIAFDPDIEAALMKLIHAGHAPQSLGPAFALLTQVLVTLRLMAPDNEPPADPAARALIAEICGLGASGSSPIDQLDGGWPLLVAAIADARHSIAAWWSAIRRGCEGSPGDFVSKGE